MLTRGVCSDVTLPYLTYLFAKPLFGAAQSRPYGEKVRKPVRHTLRMNLGKGATLVPSAVRLLYKADCLRFHRCV